MKLKKYVADSMNDALMQIKQELGSEAVILNSKQIKSGGIFGLFKKNRMEVIAALDPEPLQSRNKRTSTINSKLTKNQVNSINTNDKNQEQVLQEIKQLKKLVTSKTFQGNNPFTAPFDQFYQFLLEQEVDHEVAEDMIATIQAKNQNIEHEVDMMKAIREFLKEQLQPMEHEIPSFHKKVIQFVGPTGVGKTTTIAKVAAKTMLEEKKRVAFITTDTYRIAAIEQLKTYARILDVPLEVVYSKEDYEQALEKFATYDHVFVDTAGRNYLASNYVDELHQMIQMNDGNSMTYLVLSFTAKAADNAMIYEIFKAVGIRHLIFTKADETTSYGSMMNLCLSEKASIAYVSNGQDVPEHLVQANAGYLTELIVSRYQHA